MNEAFTVDVVSPQFPCGAAWLANALLELQVPLNHLWSYETADEWTILRPDLWRYNAEHLPWRQTLASLRLGREFSFHEHLRPRFSHAFPWQVNLCQKVVLVVRDPRDALYSEWQRHRRNLALADSVAFVDFLKQPFFGGPISHVDMLWLHLRTWLKYQCNQPARVYLLRFEDWKHDPVTSLDHVCQWMGLHASAQALEQAASASDVSHLQAVEATLLTDCPQAKQYNRAGLAGEWRSQWSAEWLTALGQHWQPVFNGLGYAPLEQDSAVAPSFDLDEVLAWRDLHAVEALEFWREQLALQQGTSC